MAGTPDDEDRQAREFIDRVVETQAKHGYGVKLSKKRYEEAPRRRLQGPRRVATSPEQPGSDPGRSERVSNDRQLGRRRPVLGDDLRLECKDVAA